MGKKKDWHIEMTEHIFHQWTVEAETKEEAIELALEGCPSDKCCGESDDPVVVEEKDLTDRREVEMVRDLIDRVEVDEEGAL